MLGLLYESLTLKEIFTEEKEYLYLMQNNCTFSGFMTYSSFTNSVIQYSVLCRLKGSVIVAEFHR